MKFLMSRLFRTSTSDTSAPLAKERLKLALSYDRTGLEQGTMEQLRGELTRVMAKHLAISAEDIQVNIDHSTGFDQLVASVPLRPSRRPRAPVAMAAPAPAATAVRRSKKARRRR